MVWPPPMTLLEVFEKDFFEFRRISYEFQNKINSDITAIKSSRKTLTPADKASNFYKITKQK